MLLFFIVFCIFILYSIVCLIFYRLFFSPYKKPDNYKKITHDKVNLPKINVSFISGKNLLHGYIYGEHNTEGLIVMVHGMGNSSDYYIPEIKYFLEHGYKVFCFDYSCYWKNEGKHFGGLIQAPIDLKNALEFVDKDNHLPITLLGHSMGGFAVCTVSQLTNVPIKNVISISGFNSAQEIIKESLGRMNPALLSLYPGFLVIQKFIFGKYTKLNATNSLNQSNVFAIIGHGANDGEVSINGCSIYAKRSQIKNSSVTFICSHESEYCEHMTVLRRKGTFEGINEELLQNITSLLQRNSCNQH